MGVPVGGLDLEHAVAHVEHRDVERATAEVEDQDGLVRLLLQAVGQRSGRRFVDDAEHVEAGDLPGVLGRLALRVVEVRGHGDDSVGHLLAEVGFCVGLELLQDQGGDLFGGELLVGVRDEHHGTVVFARLDLVRHDLALRVDRTRIQRRACCQSLLSLRALAPRPDRKT